MEINVTVNMQVYMANLLHRALFENIIKSFLQYDLAHCLTTGSCYSYTNLFTSQYILQIDPFWNFKVVTITH